MANESVIFVESSNDMYYQYEGDGGLEGQARINVGYSYNTSRVLRGAVRFNNVQIPRGATGIDAGINIYCQEAPGNQQLKVRVVGDDEDNAGDFGGGNPFGRSQTSANNHHEGTPSNGEYFGIGVGGIIEEIVGRGGWNQGNSLAFFLYDNGTSTSSSGKYIYDNFNDSPQTYLNYRVGGEPNFKPTPISVAAPTFPAVDSYGIKISYPGYDVLTATDEQEYFTTRKRELKVILQGKITTSAGSVYSIAHGKSYKPFARAYFKSISSSKRFKIPRFIPGSIQDPDADTTNGLIEVDSTNVKIMTTDACEVYYYIYVDELAT